MPKPRRKPHGARKRVQKRKSKPAEHRENADEAAFTESLITHGQAAKRNADGSLPAGATHELIEDEDGNVRVVRRRFSTL
jgi:hypothetical protein